MPSPGQPLTPEQFKAAMDKAGPAVARAMLGALAAYGRDFTWAEIPKLITRRLRTRTGDLRKSFNMEQVQRDGDVGIVIYTRLPYAKLHEYGGTIVPKTARYLTIPVGMARTRAGVKKGSARQWSDTFVGQTAGGHLAIFRKTKRMKQAKILYLLRRRVRIEPRLGLLKRWAQDDKKRRTLVADAMEAALRGKAAP